MLIRGKCKDCKSLLESPRRVKHTSKNWKGFSELFLGNLWLTSLNFENIMRYQVYNKPCAWRKVDRYILVHISWLFKLKLTLSSYKHYPNPFLIKQRRKSDNLSPKSFFRTSKQPFVIHFFLASCNVCPVGIPQISAQTQGSDYWQLIHSYFYLPGQTLF